MPSRHKNRLKVIAVSLFSLLTLVFSGLFAVAQPWDGPTDSCRNESQEQRKDHLERRLLLMAEMLELTTDQHQQIAQLFAAQSEQRAAHQQQNCEIRKALHEQLEAESLDEAAVRKLVAQEASLKADGMIESQKIKTQLSFILTPEQQALADKLKKLRRKGGPEDQHERGFF